MHGNLFAQLVLLLWIPLGMVVGRFSSPRNTVLICFFGATLFLPETLDINLPLVDLDKHSIGALAAWISCLMSHPQALKSRPAIKMAMLLLLVFFVSELGTVLTNMDALQYGQRRLVALKPVDVVGRTLQDSLHYVLPFFLGATLCGSPAQLKGLLRGYIITLLIYTPFILLEVRLAPFLHRSVYGFFHHDWRQMMRDGGFRPIAFMAHGLAVALFTSTGVIASAGAMRLGMTGFRAPMKVLHAGLWVALLACKSLAALIYSLAFVPLTLFSSTRTQLRAAKVLSLAVLGFPLLRAMGWVPVGWLLARAYEIDPQREGSLRFRFINEDMLLERAQERILFGWGGWGRNRVFDTITGEDLSVTDGQWVLSLGFGGLAFFVLQFGMILFPVLFTGRALAWVGSKDRQIYATLSLMLVACSVDLIPNALFQFIPFLLAGALYGANQWRPEHGALRVTDVPSRGGRQ